MRRALFAAFRNAVSMLCPSEVGSVIGSNGGRPYPRRDALVNGLVNIL